MEIQIQIQNGQSQAGTVEVSEQVFAADFNEALVHQVVTAYLADMRAGTKAQKTRSEVSGGGKKPWRQKGSGRARAGSIRSPLWRGGGVTFAAKPRSYTQKVNRKMYRAALRSIFSELLRQDRLMVIPSFHLEDHKTKGFLNKASEMNFGEHFLMIVGELDVNTYFAARNLPNVLVIDVASINPVSLIKYNKVIIEESALNEINEWLL